MNIAKNPAPGAAPGRDAAPGRGLDAGPAPDPDAGPAHGPARGPARNQTNPVTVPGRARDPVPSPRNATAPETGTT